MVKGQPLTGRASCGQIRQRPTRQIVDNVDIDAACTVWIVSFGDEPIDHV